MSLIYAYVKFLIVSDRTVTSFRALSKGQRGEVYEVNGDRAAVILDIGEVKVNDVSKEDKEPEQPEKPPVYWLDGNISFPKEVALASFDFVSSRNSLL